MLNFETEQQQQNLIKDFRAALLFVSKLDDLKNEKISNLLPENCANLNYKDAIELFDKTEPLENVLDYYGGNSEKMFNHFERDGEIE